MNEKKNFLNETNSDLNLKIDENSKIIQNFHSLYYNSRVWENTRFLNWPILKCPLDMWIYQEIICETSPDLIIETGTFFGGSALYMAFICDILGKGKIITVDICPNPQVPKHRRITYLNGSSIAPEIITQIKSMNQGSKSVMVILDSDHSCAHVTEELKLYNEFVTEGNYLIVEDSNVNGNPIKPDFGPGPMEAIEIFLKAHREFTIDKGRAKFFMTQNPNGFLKKNKSE